MIFKGRNIFHGKNSDGNVTELDRDIMYMFTVRNKLIIACKLLTGQYIYMKSINVPIASWMNISININDRQFTLFNNGTVQTNIIINEKMYTNKDPSDAFETEFNTITIGNSASNPAITVEKSFITNYIYVKDNEISVENIKHIYNQSPIDNGLLETIGYGIRNPVYKLPTLLLE